MVRSVQQAGSTGGVGQALSTPDAAYRPQFVHRWRPDSGGCGEAACLPDTGNSGGGCRAKLLHGFADRRLHGGLRGACALLTWLHPCVAAVQAALLCETSQDDELHMLNELLPGCQAREVVGVHAWMNIAWMYMYITTIMIHILYFTISAADSPQTQCNECPLLICRQIYWD